MKISIIIPCYNESERIAKTLDRVHEFLLTKQYEYEVLVVDNGSRDKTVKIIESAQQRMPELKLVRRKSYGKGWAVKQGMLEATGDYRLFTDADNSTDISHLDSLLIYAEQGYDVVISSRRAEGAHIIHPQPWHRVMLGNIFAYIVHKIVPVDVKDTQNGFKLFSKRAAEAIFPRQSTYFWAFDVEILAMAKKMGFRIKEVPITWVNDDRSQMSFKGMVRMLVEVINIRLMLFTKK